MIARHAPSTKKENAMNDSARKLTIAVDGPAGAGKSTIASALAKRLGYTNLETGAMYRALGLKALQHGVSLDDEDALYCLALGSRIELEPTPNGNRVLLDGKEITEAIRTQEVSDAASRVSVHPKVRVWMVGRQREMGAGGGVVMEGRDIGTKVFPNAEVKIFLDANPDVRAQRRVVQNVEKLRDVQTGRRDCRRDAAARPARQHTRGFAAGPRGGRGHA